MASYSSGKVWNDTECNKKNETVRFTVKMIEEKQANTIVISEHTRLLEHITNLSYNV